MNIFNIERTLNMKLERGWSSIYVAVDAHGTIFKPYHDTLEFYPGAVEVLRWFSWRPDFKLILWSSSFPSELEKMDDLCFRNGIGFNYINQNPAEKNTKLADFSSKFYFNILLDDKSGMSAETDWFLIKNELIRLGMWCNKNSKGKHKWGIDGNHSNQYCKDCFVSRPKWDTLQLDYEV